MNDSRYGLTASIWTTDVDAALRIGDRVETGTWFMNRCDYLDPALAWTGVKDSGRGCTLSQARLRGVHAPEVVSPAAEVVAPYQIAFTPNCICRGAFACDVTCPTVALFSVVFGDAELHVVAAR